MRRRMPRAGLLRLSPILVVTILGLTLAACGDDDEPTGPENGGPEIAESWIEDVSVAGGSAEVVEEDAPAASGGPSVQAALSGSFITGGTTELSINSIDSFDGLILALDGVDGYVDVGYGSGRSSADVLVTLRDELPSSGFSLRVAGTQGAEVGDYTEIPVEVVQVGTGQIQVSVSWDAPSDVDLHVVEPSGDEVYYGNEEVGSGGELDLDSNAGCGIDGVNNENITWTDEDSPQSGEYIVRVNYWSDCSVAETNYVVTVRAEGLQTRTYTGQFTGEGNGGGRGSGVEITRFDF